MFSFFRIIKKKLWRLLLVIFDCRTESVNNPKMIMKNFSLNGSRKFIWNATGKIIETKTNFNRVSKIFSKSILFVFIFLKYIFVSAESIPLQCQLLVVQMLLNTTLTQHRIFHLSASSSLPIRQEDVDGHDAGASERITDHSRLERPASNREGSFQGCRNPRSPPLSTVVESPSQSLPPCTAESAIGSAEEIRSTTETASLLYQTDSESILAGSLSTLSRWIGISVQATLHKSHLSASTLECLWYPHLKAPSTGFNVVPRLTRILAKW